LHPLCLLLWITVFATLLSSCSVSRADASFARKIEKIDALELAGKNASALRSLSHLRNRAGSATQWLSIARRERALGDYSASVKTLKVALASFPSNEALCAVMADSLIELGSYESAAVYAATLASEKFAPLKAYAEIKRSLAAASLPSPECYVRAFDATGNALFRNNAAALYAGLGNYAAACALFPEEVKPSSDVTAQIGDAQIEDVQTAVEQYLEPLSPDLYFHALLCYDGLKYDSVLELLPEIDDPRLTREMSALLADCAWKTGDSVRSRAIWERLTAQYPDYSPIPYYDLALTSGDFADEYARLEQCLALFPSWYPAVARYARSVAWRDSDARAEGAGESNPTDEGDSDVAEQSLLDAGFMSLDMESGRRNSRISRDKAAAALERALTAGTSAPDVRLKIEAIRFSLGADRDILRSSAEMWKLLEAYDDNPVLYQYATWFFAATGNFDTAFSLNRANPGGANPFYSGLEAAMTGKMTEAIEEFDKVANNETDSWTALANVAKLAAKARDYNRAAETAALAASMAPDARVKSRLYGDQAEYLVALNRKDMAQKILAYALNLDPFNYRAAAYLRKLDSEQ
jgi:tetratricopeptide (TPR) repeat protein